MILYSIYLACEELFYKIYFKINDVKFWFEVNYKDVSNLWQIFLVVADFVCDRQKIFPLQKYILCL